MTSSLALGVNFGTAIVTKPLITFRAKNVDEDIPLPFITFRAGQHIVRHRVGAV